MIHTLMGGRIETGDQKARYRKQVAKDLGEAAAARIDDLQAESFPLLDCVISPRQWSEIGDWQESSRKTIPATLDQESRPINTRVRGYKAME